MPISLSNSRNLNLDAGIKPISAFFAVTWHPTKIFNHFFYLKNLTPTYFPGCEAKKRPTEVDLLGEGGLQPVFVIQNEFAL